MNTLWFFGILISTYLTARCFSLFQVWFQNARAKWRRMMIKQEGKSGEKCAGTESGNTLSDMESFQTHGPGAVGPEFHQQPIPPHSPHFVLGSSSPAPLECS